ncbi:MAG: hypothetical protein HYU66_29275 [Armatimonadetes bacterium]|nr:hypothetical protein [Armatimonadota bacterium]
MRAVLPLLPLLLAANARTEDLPAFGYPDSAAAQEHWQPMAGSPPVRAETLADGSTCLVLEAVYAKEGERCGWDWHAPLDLSQAGRVAFEVSCDRPGLVRTIGMYFGTANGWYPTYWLAPRESWGLRSFGLERFGREGEPDGWDKVTTFRFSAWGAAPGKCTFRLRRMRTLSPDPAENLLRNGSFEVPGVGVPYGWGSGHWGVGDLPWAADMDLWRRHFHLDATVAHDGKASLCLDNKTDLPLLRAVSVWLAPPWGKAQQDVPKYTLSAWLRSDQERLPVMLGAVKVEVGRDWVQGVARGVAFAGGAAVTIAPQAPGKLWIDAVQVQRCPEPTPEFHPQPDDEALNVCEADVDWSPPRRTAEVAAGRTVTGPTPPAPVRIDEHGRFLVGGRPYLMHSFGLEFVRNLDILDLVARSGFADVCIQVQPGVSPAELRGYLDRCERVGLRLIPWLDGRIPREQFGEMVRTLKDHPALLCWYVMDEPSGEAGLAEAAARLRLCKELDPGHPAFINYLSDRLTQQAGDLFSTDVYPIPHGRPTDAIQSVATMKTAADKRHAPVWMWLQGTGYAYWMDREPTPRELSCMVYGSLIAGARGIYWFAQVPRTKECFAEMRALCVELDTLAPVLGSLDPAPATTCDAASVMCRAYREDGRTWVLAVNTTGNPVAAGFALAGAAGDVAVVFEGRRVPAQAGAWRDELGPYERHVYRLAGQ